jgi:superfamily I DNA/RNA helicase
LKDHRYFTFFEDYQKSLTSNRIIDFMDMISIAIQILEDNPDLTSKYSNRWKYILVDEFQDLNPSQFKLLMLLLRNHSNVTIVGDDDQSIYGFRGGTSKLFAKFRTNFPQHIERHLQVNYRSKATIVNASQSVIKNNSYRTKKVVTTHNEDGEKINIFGAHSKEEELQFIVDGIRKLISAGNNYRDIAILSRLSKNALNRFEDEMKKQNIPFVRFRKKGFSDREIVRIMLSYLSLLVNPYDDEAFRKVINIPNRQIGDSAQSYMEQYRLSLKKNTSLLQALEKAVIAGFPATKNDLKVKANVQKSFKAFLELIKELQKECCTTDLPELLTLVASKIGCKSYAQKVKGQEEKRRARIQLVKDRKKQKSGNVTARDDDGDGSDTEDLEIEYNTDENLKQLVEQAQKLIDFRFTEDEYNHISKDERLDLLKEFIDVTNGEEDERELMEKQSNPDAITVSTIHGAKGLEWKHVFIVHANTGVMPIHYFREGDTDEEYDSKEEHFEEERRLFYVAVSRAKKSVRISYIVEKEKDKPSMYLKEIDKQFVTIVQDNQRQSNQPVAQNVQQVTVRPRSAVNNPVHVTKITNQQAQKPINNNQIQQRKFKPIPSPNQNNKSVGSTSPPPTSITNRMLDMLQQKQTPTRQMRTSTPAATTPTTTPTSTTPVQQTQKKFTFKPIVVKPENGTTGPAPVTTTNQQKTTHSIVNSTPTSSNSKQFKPVPKLIQQQNSNHQVSQQQVISSSQSKKRTFNQITPATSNSKIRRQESDEFSDGLLFGDDEDDDLFGNEDEDVTQANKRSRTYL